MGQSNDFSKTDLEVLHRELQVPGQPIGEMTRNYYFKVVKYALSGFDSSVLQPEAKYVKQMQRRMVDKAQRYKLNPDIFLSDDVLAYNKYTVNWVGDAIDNFGTIEKPDCPKDFQKWYDKYAYNGGHPFEIYPYICLYVRRKKDNFYLELADFDAGSIGRSQKLLKMFVALRQAGIPVELRNRDLFLQFWQNYNLKNR